MICSIGDDAAARLDGRVDLGQPLCVACCSLRSLFPVLPSVSCLPREFFRVVPPASDFAIFAVLLAANDDSLQTNERAEQRRQSMWDVFFFCFDFVKTLRTQTHTLSLVDVPLQPLDQSSSRHSPAATPTPHQHQHQQQQQQRDGNAFGYQSTADLHQEQQREAAGHLRRCLPFS